MVLTTPPHPPPARECLRGYSRAFGDALRRFQTDTARPNTRGGSYFNFGEIENFDYRDFGSRLRDRPWAHGVRVYSYCSKGAVRTFASAAAKTE